MPGPGKCFRDLVMQSKSPIQIVGAINAYSALMAKQSGFKCIYLSGSGVATASHGLPDLGITTLDDVVEDAKRIVRVVGDDSPLLVDIDTGFGTSIFNIQRTIRELESVGVAAVHIEDQVVAKRCGHRPNIAIVSAEEMIDRIQAAVLARKDKDFVIMARTDALEKEGLESAIIRAKKYIEAGADMIFAEACTTLAQYKTFSEELSVPILANITEFGKTPLFSTEELGSVGVKMVLYPLTAFRCMNKAAMEAYQTILKNGTQKDLLPKMQTRQELYEIIDYYDYEKQIDKLNSKYE